MFMLAIPWSSIRSSKFFVSKRRRSQSRTGDGQPSPVLFWQQSRGYAGDATCSLHDRIFLSENFRGKRLDGCAPLPRIDWQAGFAAGLFEEGNAVPAML